MAPTNVIIVGLPEASYDPNSLRVTQCDGVNLLSGRAVRTTDQSVTTSKVTVLVSGVQLTRIVQPAGVVCPGLSFFRGWTVLVVGKVALQDHEDQQDNSSDDWYEADQYPETGPTGVMKSADGDSQAGYENSQPVNCAEQPQLREQRVTVNGTVSKESEDERDDHVEQKEPPILAAPGPAIKFGILSQNLEVPVHPRLRSNQVRLRCTRRLQRAAPIDRRYAESETSRIHSRRRFSIRSLCFLLRQVWTTAGCMCESPHQSRR